MDNEIDLNPNNQWFSPNAYEQSMINDYYKDLYYLLKAQELYENYLIEYISGITDESIEEYMERQ